MTGETKIVAAAREWYTAGRATDASWQANSEAEYSKETSLAHALAIDRLHDASKALRAAIEEMGI